MGAPNNRSHDTRSIDMELLSSINATAAQENLYFIACSGKTVKKGSILKQPATGG